MNWGAFAAQVKQPLAMPASPVRVPVPVLTILLLMQVAATEPRKAAEVGPHTCPYHAVGDQNGVPGPWPGAQPIPGC